MLEDYNYRVNHELLSELFSRASDYHAALAHYARAVGMRSELEDAAQEVVGTSMRYRMAIDRLIEDNDPDTLAVVAGRGRLERMRRSLANASLQYNIQKRVQARPPAPLRRA